MSIEYCDKCGDTFQDYNSLCPDCRAVGSSPCSLDIECPSCGAEYRVPDPVKAINSEWLGNILAHNRVIDQLALEDPEGYDGGVMLECLAHAAEELTEFLKENK